MNEIRYQSLDRIVFIPSALNNYTIFWCVFIHLTSDVLKGSAIFLERDNLNLETTDTVFFELSCI